MNLKEYIIERSKELDIDLIGFTDCEPFYQVKDYLIERKEKNKETEFEEENLEKRINPKLTFPGCKSIIAIGLSYNNTFNEEADYKLKGALSRSSWGQDYHIVLRKRIEALINEIGKIVDFNYKYFVDTGPLIDREIARRTGIGYYGKNCSIINNEYGSFIFLAYILTDLEIDNISTPLESQCGDCIKCIKACPTGALEKPYKANPKKCISYLTQTKNDISHDLRGKMGNKIYGCDICQKVCPKNRNVKIPNHREFIPVDTKGYIDLEKLLTMTNREFKEKYGQMSGSWRGRNILKRNGIISIANMKNVEYLDLLYPLLKESSAMIREYSRWAIENLK